MITAGGELTLKELELRYSPQSQFYIAPLQWKANSGILIVDDFGRQMIQPKELLNRWIVPMEERVDHLSLHTGDMVEVPFDVLLIFSTNLHPSQLGDEAFFRRIRHKIEIPDPTREQFLEILARVCQQREMPLDPDAALLPRRPVLHARWTAASRAATRATSSRSSSDICVYHGERAGVRPRATSTRRRTRTSSRCRTTAAKRTRAVRRPRRLPVGLPPRRSCSVRTSSTTSLRELIRTAARLD